MHLDETTFKAVVKHAPLISIDLVVSRGNGDILLGKRKNRPARGFWFVPGGRIFKDESLDAAFLRLTLAELGRPVLRSDCTMLGIYEHMYPDNFSGSDFSTHYVVLAYRVELDRLMNLPDEQHSDYLWMSPDELLADKLVHQNTKAYFQVGSRPVLGPLDMPSTSNP